MAKSFEELLETFNINPLNNEIIDYISRANIFDTIKKSRNEMVHSRMVAELIAGRYFDVSRKQTLIHFFDIIIKRAQQQGKLNGLDNFKSAVLTRSLKIDSVKKKLEYPIKTYQKKKYKNNNNKNNDYKGSERLDIFLDIILEKTLQKKREIEIIIENKVLSHESDNQTNIYFKNCKKDLRSCFQFFVFITPLASYELDDYKNLNTDYKPQNENFIQICYQDILDYVISPLVNENMSARDRVILEEYVNCLELPAMPNEKDDNGINITNRELSIMAVSQKEKMLLKDFWDDPDNKQLLNVVQAVIREKALYTYNDKYYTIDQLLPKFLKNYIEKNKKSEQHILVEPFKDIIGKQRSGTPFLVYREQQQYFDCEKKKIQLNQSKYTQIPNTDFFYRHDILFNRFNRIIDVLNTIEKISEMNTSEKNLIKSFFNNHIHQNLMLSVYRIITEIDEITGTDRRAYYTGIYNDLRKKIKEKTTQEDQDNKENSDNDDNEMESVDNG